MSPRARRAAWTGAVLFSAVALLITALKGEPTVEFDEHFGLPLKPDEPYLTGNHIGVTIAMTLVGLSGVVLGLRHFVKKRTLLPLMVALGGAFICIPEVFFDIMGGVYFPWSDTEPLGHAYTIMGREMPWWIVAGWFGYGAFAYFEYLLLANRPSTKSIWLFFAAAVAGDIVFEEVLLKFDTYHYYGNQPLVLLWELPWWWIACNPAGVLLGATLAYRYRARLQGWRALAMLVIMPMAVATVYGATALPSWIAVNSDYPWLVTQALGLMTLLLGFVTFLLILRFVLNRNPFDFDYVPTADDEFRSGGSAAPQPPTPVVEAAPSR
ncbi:hypothetical protein ACFS2C_02550 [Prauserella oleivorans]|uniref:Uncharacterized protein n=1 Tax=Prauserella oleivorans TaxID=1478153 RepID=A0ABW5W4Z4_9PSEU